MARDLKMPGGGRNRSLWTDIIIHKMPKTFQKISFQNQVKTLNPVIDQIIEALDAAYTIGVRDGKDGQSGERLA